MDDATARELINALREATATNRALADEVAALSASLQDLSVMLAADETAVPGAFFHS